MDTLDLEQEDSHEDALQEQAIIDAAELRVEVNAANSAVETLQKYYDLVEVSEANGGVNTTAADAINIGLESIDSMFALEAVKEISLEAITDRINQINSMAKQGLEKISVLEASVKK